MSIPHVNHSAWSDVITGKVAYDFECLALKILLARLSLTAKADPARLPACTNELYDFFVKNPQLPSAQRDLKKIFG